MASLEMACPQDSLTGGLASWERKGKEICMYVGFVGMEEGGILKLSVNSLS